MALVSSTLTTYTKTASLLHIQKVAPIIGWEDFINTLEQWSVFLTLIMGMDSRHPFVYELTMLIGASQEVNTRLREKDRYQPSMLAALVQLIQTEFNNI